MLGNNIKKYRKNRHWTQEELAIQVSTVRQTISKWEKGYSVPDASTLVRLSEVFDCSVSDLLGQEVELKESNESIAHKLETLNLILARRENRWRKVWKIILYIIIAWVVLILLFGTVRFT